MQLHPEAAAVLAFVESLELPEIHTVTPDEAREGRAALRAPASGECHHIEDVDAGGVPARLYRSNDDVTGLTIWIHGGGWVTGDVDGHETVCRSLANRSGHAVLSVGYRLAPEDPFPAGLHDCLTATRWARESAHELGIDPDRIAIAGDSAGANLAAAVANDAPIALRFQLLIYPVADAQAAIDQQTYDSYQENGDGYFLTAAAMRWFVDQYLAGDEGAPDDPRVSPLYETEERLAAAPPALVITAGFDPLRDEGMAYAARLSAAGVDTSHVHLSGQIHGFFSLLTVLSDARMVHALVGQALADALA